MVENVARFYQPLCSVSTSVEVLFTYLWVLSQQHDANMRAVVNRTTTIVITSELITPVVTKHYINLSLAEVHAAVQDIVSRPGN